MAQVRIYVQLVGRGKWPSQMVRIMKAGRLGQGGLGRYMKARREWAKTDHSITA